MPILPALVSCAIRPDDRLRARIGEADEVVVGIHTSAQLGKSPDEALAVPRCRRLLETRQVQPPELGARFRIKGLHRCLCRSTEEPGEPQAHPVHREGDECPVGFEPPPEDCRYPGVGTDAHDSQVATRLVGVGAYRCGLVRRKVQELLPQEPPVCNIVDVKHTLRRHERVVAADVADHVDFIAEAYGSASGECVRVARSLLA
mmetsp:Transcript_64323/g.149657  ORF Transcript_64323/g.149657 Transcript_64323/m.149657 type:complete len:203 (-) Transcript_64323:698-1306(-)